MFGKSTGKSASRALERYRKLTNDSLHVSIRTRRSVLFEGDVFSLSSFNTLGEFSVLPKHANFISLIHDKVILDKGSASEQIFEVGTGLINVDDTGVAVYVGLGESA